MPTNKTMYVCMLYTCEKLFLCFLRQPEDMFVCDLDENELCSPPPA